MATAAPANSATPHCGYSKLMYIQMATGNYVARIETISKSNDSWHCQLSYGDRGEGVRTLQWTLNKCYNAGLTIDQIFGPKTREALMSAQRKAEVNDDGIYGPNTRGALLRPTYTYSHGDYAGCRSWN